MKKDDSLKYWLDQLCKSMNQTISTSGDINRCIENIKAQGFDLCLFLEATVCVSQEEADKESPLHQYKRLLPPAEKKKRKRLRLNRGDRECLDSLKITIRKNRSKPTSGRRHKS